LVLFLDLDVEIARLFSYIIFKMKDI